MSILSLYCFIVVSNLFFGVFSSLWKEEIWILEEWPPAKKKQKQNKKKKNKQEKDNNNKSNKSFVHFALEKEKLH